MNHRTVQAIAAAVEALDWDFVTSRRENLHWYCSAFVPEIPYNLLNILRRYMNIQHVFDPFAGAGTTLVEAAKAGFGAWGCDNNPVSEMICSLLNTFLSLQDREYLRSDFLEGCRAEHETTIPNLAENQGWYHPETLVQLGRIYTAIERESESGRKLLARLCFSSILKACSSQTDHYTYIADNCRVALSQAKYVDAIERFSSKVLVNLTIIERFYKTLAQQVNPDVLGALQEIHFRCCDYSNTPVFSEEQFDVILTSPPYANVTDYTYGQRLSYLWFTDWNMMDDYQHELGARRTRFRSSAVEEYRRAMERCLGSIHAQLVNGGVLCLILGQTSGRGAAYDIVAEIIRMATHEFGLDIVTKEPTRRITGKKVRTKRGVSHERLVILKKEN